MSDSDSLSSSSVPRLMERVGGIMRDDDDSSISTINVWTDYFLLYDEGGHAIDDPAQAVLIKNKYNDPITDENWELMGNALRENTVLTQLRLANCSMSNASIVCLLSGEGRQCCSYPLEVFVSQQNRFGARGLESLLPFLQGIPTLRNLGLNGANLGQEKVSSCYPTHSIIICTLTHYSFVKMILGMRI